MNLQNECSLYFTASGDKVRCHVAVVVGDKKFIYTLTATESSEFGALLSSEALTLALRERIEMVRRYEYERGYRAGRNKKGKFKYFPTTLHIREEA